MRQFSRGERAKLSELAAINHIWEVEVSVDAPFFIVDFCCLGLDAQGQVVDDSYLISYNQPDAPNGAIQMNNASNNGAIFTIYLENLSASVRRLVFTATLHEPEMPGGLVGAAFSLLGPKLEVGEGHLLLSTPAKNAGVVAFSGTDFGEGSTLVLGEFYWRDEWRFVAAGQPLKGELGAFLRTLTDGPMPAPIAAPVSTPISTPIAVPPRPPRVTPTQVPQPVQWNSPTAIPTAPNAPIPLPVRAPVVPPPTPAQPVAQSLSKAVKEPIASPSPIPINITSLPQIVPDGGKLQDLIDAAIPHSTLTLMSDEYEGPIKIDKPLVLEGRGSALWGRVGPVVTITSAEVTLHNLDIELTTQQETKSDKSVALKVEHQLPQLQLNNVRVRGRISGLGNEDGEWNLPSLLDLGTFAARVRNEFSFVLRVPTSVNLSSPIEGFSISPTELKTGEHQIRLILQDIAPETLIIGHIEVRSASLIRTIPVSGNAVLGISASVVENSSFEGNK